MPLRISVIRRKLSPGQTMIEVIVALTLIILFLSGVVIVELYAIKNADYSRNKSVSSQLAKQQIERARVIRDSAGIEALAVCQGTCFINNELTPVPVTPTGTYGQSLTIESASIADCPLPDVTIIPEPAVYKAKAYVSWDPEAVITPAAYVELISCISDWR